MGWSKKDLQGNKGEDFKMKENLLLKKVENVTQKCIFGLSIKNKDQRLFVLGQYHEKHLSKH